MIRKFKEHDTTCVMGIWKEASSLAHPFLNAGFVKKVGKDLKNLYLPNSKTWVYVEDEMVIAFISMINNEIGGIFVSPEEHARGIGTQLVNFVGLIHDHLEVEVFEKNVIGRAFYTKYGFSHMKKYLHEESQESILRLKCTTG
ncbi:MAG: GNAT family N-acetyltransferase [Aurantibacter sp.]